MVRSGPFLLLLTLVASPTHAQEPSNTEYWRLRDVNLTANAAPALPGATIGAGGRFGLGMFGLKLDHSRQRAVIARDIDAPKVRRAGVGFSLKF
jgi:hypothetical protein